MLVIWKQVCVYARQINKGVGTVMRLIAKLESEILKIDILLWNPV